jgi:SPP1 gp7 family putative phage head morphogenesis protein
MWSYVDEQLKKYLKQHKTNDRELEYRIQNVFNMGFEFSSLYNYANNGILRQFKTRIRLFKENYTKNDYVSYMVNKYQNRTRIKNNEILRIMLLMEYAEVYDKNYNNQLALFDEISKSIVKVTNAEVENVLRHKKRKFRRHPFIYEHIFLLHLLAMPNNLGVTWEEHTASIIDYNSDQCYKQAVIDLRNDDLKVDKDLIESQTKREINYKSNRLDDKFFGQIDNEVTYLVNQERIQIFKYYGITKVQFKALIDERTTEECREMNGKVFDIDKLVLGENLPPLHYNCRSVIEAYSVK